MSLASIIEENIPDDETFFTKVSLSSENDSLNQLNFNGIPTIITTSRKRVVIDQLGDYWHLKSLFLRIRKSPSLILEKDNLNCIVDFLDKYTDLRNESFWCKLKRKHKLGAARHFTISEGHREKQYIQSTSRRPELFVLLSGSVLAVKQIKNDSEDLIYHQGNLFGTVDRFQSWYESNYGVDEGYSDMSSSTVNSEANPTPIRLTASIEMCTLLRLSFKDYIHGVTPPKSLYDGLDETEYMIATNPDLSEEDILCLRLWKQSKKTLSKTLFRFLKDYSILPKDSKSNSYQYMRIGNIGRELSLSKEDSRVVYVIISGTMRLELTKPRNSDGKLGSSSLSLKRAGEPALVIKNNRMPVMLLEMGSVFIINENCFDITNMKDTSISTRPITPGSFLSTRQSSDTPKSGSANRKTRKVISEIKEELYRIQVIFERPTTYLAIPLELFRNAMKETSVEINKEITIQLNQISNSLVERISKLMPWIAGEMKFLMKVSN